MIDGRCLDPEAVLYVDYAGRTREANFFPGRGEDYEPAKRVCRRCPVQAECLEFALASGERYGVWGGTSERERRVLRQRRRLRASQRLSVGPPGPS